MVITFASLRFIYMEKILWTHIEMIILNHLVFQHFLDVFLLTFFLLLDRNMPPHLEKIRSDVVMHWMIDISFGICQQLR